MSPSTEVLVKFENGKKDCQYNAEDFIWTDYESDHRITHYAVINKDSTTEKSYTLQYLWNLYDDMCFESDWSIPEFIDYIKQQELKSEREYKTYLELKAKYENETKHRS